MLKCQLEYNVSSTPVIATGISYTSSQLNQAFQGPVKNILNDSIGQDELTDLLSELATTDFEQQELTQVLNTDISFEDWLVGEAIAEAVVGELCECEYPWPTSRDLKNSNASPAGCDLTGLQKIDDGELPYRFSFGEVKTSREQSAPPGVMSSMRTQLFGLRDDKLIKRDLVKYLGRHSLGRDWECKYKSAAKRYLRSGGTDIAIHGVLIRDTQPVELDLRSHVQALAIGCPNLTHIELYAVYLPTGEITNLPKLAQSALADEEVS